MAFLKSVYSRSYCTALVKPPVQVFGIDGRYAAALYSAAHKQGKLPEVENELAKFQETLMNDNNMRETIANPTIQRKQKSEVLKEIAAKASLSSYSSNLLQILAENGRAKRIIPVIKAFRVIMAAHRGEVSCEVTTAKALEDAQKEKLLLALKKFVAAEQTIHLKTHVDPAIMGGMVVSIGDRFVDMSIQTKIKKYIDLMSAPV